MFGQCIIDLIGILLVLMRYPEDVEHLTDDKVRRPGHDSFPPRPVKVVEQPTNEIDLDRRRGLLWSP